MKSLLIDISSRLTIAASLILSLAAATPSIRALDFSKYNLTPEQISTFASLDSATQAKIIDYLEKQQGGNGSKSTGGSLGKDSINSGTFQNNATAQSETTLSEAGGNASGAPASSIPPGAALNFNVSPQTNHSSTQAPDAGTLKPYGYDIFSGGNQFEPTIQVPMPENYVLGVGDTVDINLYGKTSASYELTITREGNLEVPDLGVVNVAGMTFTDARNEIMLKIKNHMIGVEASVTMGELRSMKVFIMGEVVHPGSYAVSSMATITNALFACGGIKESGSLRKIQLKRSGKLVVEMDLYELLMRGDNSRDSRLEPGDVILVPSVGATVSVTGNVVRPAIYETKGETKVSDLLELAGGCRPDTYMGVSQMSRIDPSTNKRYIVSVNLASPSDYSVSNGDELLVMKIPERVLDSVEIKGHVALPRSVQWREGMTLADAIPTMNDVLKDADLVYVIVKSTDPATDRTSIRSTRLDMAIKDRNSKWNLKLNPMDEIIVFGDQEKSKNPCSPDNVTPTVTSGSGIVGQPVTAGANGNGLPNATNDLRNSNAASIVAAALGTSCEKSSDSDVVNQERFEWISCIVSQIKAQRIYDEPVDTVKVTGAVRYPDEYPFEKGMRVLDLLRASQNVVPDSEMNYALLVRRDGNKSQVISLRLPSSLDDENSPWNCQLNPRDELHVFSMYDDRALEIKPYLNLLQRQSTPDEFPKKVSIFGMVRHPGTYPMNDGMRISDIVRAGGGFIAGAYTDVAEVTRSYVSEDKTYRIKHFTIDMASILKGDSSADIALQPLDNVIIRSVPLWTEDIKVTIKGEVDFPGTYTVSDDETLSQLIKRAGGISEHAFAKGAVFIRESLRQKEQAELDRLRERLRSDLAAAAMQKTVPTKETVEFSAGLLNELENAKAVGRMTIDLSEIIKGSNRFPDIILKDGDTLYIPKPQEEVTVIGEVMYPTSHIFRKGLDYKDYIRMSGGVSIHADSGRIYLIKANGAVQTAEGSSIWFRSRLHVEPGDSIVVPFDAEYISPLPMWKDVTGIIYNLAVSAAAIASF